MTRQSALELATRDIRVNAVCPGYIDTPMSGDEESYALAEAMTPLGRMGQIWWVLSTIWRQMKAAISRVR